MKNKAKTYPKRYIRFPQNTPILSLLKKNGEEAEQVDLSITHFYCRASLEKKGLLCLSYWKPEYVSRSHLETMPMSFDPACYIGDHKVILKPNWKFEAWLIWNETTGEVKVTTSVITRDRWIKLCFDALDSPAVASDPRRYEISILFASKFSEGTTQDEINEEWHKAKATYCLPLDYKAKLEEIKKKLYQDESTVVGL